MRSLDMGASAFSANRSQAPGGAAAKVGTVAVVGAKLKIETGDVKIADKLLFAKDETFEELTFMCKACYVDGSECKKSKAAGTIGDACPANSAGKTCTANVPASHGSNKHSVC